MKITFEETLSRKEWLHKELMESLTGDIIAKASEDQFYDVKLLVNGVELEPAFYNKLVNNIEKYIDSEAKSLVRQKLEEAEEKSRKLSELIDAAKNSIIDEFNIDDEDF
jgi:ferritin-like metal-binding protein YciE